MTCIGPERARFPVTVNDELATINIERTHFLARQHFAILFEVLSHSHHCGAFELANLDATFP